jgi:hypothetical protein
VVLCKKWGSEKSGNLGGFQYVAQLNMTFALFDTISGQANSHPLIRTMSAKLHIFPGKSRFWEGPLGCRRGKDRPCRLKNLHTICLHTRLQVSWLSNPPFQSRTWACRHDEHTGPMGTLYTRPMLGNTITRRGLHVVLILPCSSMEQSRICLPDLKNYSSALPFLILWSILPWSTVPCGSLSLHFAIEHPAMEDGVM